MFKDKLFSMREPQYKDFMSKLLPTVEPERIIGVRVPTIRTLAKDAVKQADTQAFLCSLPHQFYEEDMLHAFIIAAIKDHSLCISEINRFLPYVDNWGVCDSLRPKCFSKHKSELLTEINKWLSSNHPYTVRFAIEMLMVNYLDSDFTPDHLSAVAKIDSNEYYVRMMVAWYFATALAKQYDSALPYLEARALPEWTHNKTIQKAIESYRLGKEQKDYLRSLKHRNTIRG